jgi:hypothetical protein
VQRRPEQHRSAAHARLPGLGEVSLRAAAGCGCRPARGHDGIRLALQAGRLPGSRGEGAVAAPWTIVVSMTGDHHAPCTASEFTAAAVICSLAGSPACARIAVHGSSPALRDRNPGIRRQIHVSPSWGLPEDVEPVYPGAALPDPGLGHDVVGRAVQRPSAAGADDLDVEVRQRRPDQAELAGRTAISRSSCSLVISPRNRSSAQPAATHHRTPAPASRPATSRGRQASQGGSPPASAQPAASHHQP